jgi:putative membrane protein
MNPDEETRRIKKWPWVAAALFLFVNGFFVAKLDVYPELQRVGSRPEMAMVSAIFVLLFALPSFWAVVKWLGPPRGLLTLVCLGVFAITIETIAVKTGQPYGRFEYGSKIGGKIFDAVPWTVPFAWTPLLLGAMPVAHRLNLGKPASPGLTKFRLFFWAAWILTAIDGVLDPGAVSQKFWTYLEPGDYYGVPYSNYFGWLLSGLLGAWLFDALTRGACPPRAMLASALLILLFWSSVCFWSGLWIPMLLGIGLLIWFFRFYFIGVPDSEGMTE